jgi:hypothetical protein
VVRLWGSQRARELHDCMGLLRRRSVVLGLGRLALPCLADVMLELILWERTNWDTVSKHSVCYDVLCQLKN